MNDEPPIVLDLHERHPLGVDIDALWFARRSRHGTVWTPARVDRRYVTATGPTGRTRRFTLPAWYRMTPIRTEPPMDDLHRLAADLAATPDVEAAANLLTALVGAEVDDVSADLLADIEAAAAEAIRTVRADPRDDGTGY